MEIFQSTKRRGDEGNIGIERDIDILVDIYNLDSTETWLDDVATCFVSFDEETQLLFLLFLLANIYIDDYIYFERSEDKI